MERKSQPSIQIAATSHTAASVLPTELLRRLSFWRAKDHTSITPKYTQARTRSARSIRYSSPTVWFVTILGIVLSLFILKSVVGPRPVAAATSVFINEIHYDNTGADVGEAVEVAGPAGTSLAGWTIALYNGNPTVRTVYDTIPLSGTIPNQSNGFGVLSFPRAGIQNGGSGSTEPDGLALVNASSSVVQFLSYEGSFVALNGPAAGLTSTNIGVFQTGAEPVGQSLQLSGTGCMYEDFTWNSSAANTFGAINTGQTSTCGGGDAAPSVSSTIPADGASGVSPSTNISITFSESVNATTSSFTVECPPGTPVGFSLSSSPATTFTLDPTSNLPAGAVCNVRVVANQISDEDANDPPDQMAADHLFSFSVESPPITSNIIINEVDSDTPGADVAEFIELYDGGVGNTSLTGLVVVLFNGSNDLSYGAFDLDGRTTDANGYFVLGNPGVTGVDFTFTAGLLQNGADAVAIYQGDATSFPNNTPVTTTNLIDAVVYDTADADDPGLLVLLNSGQPQVDEDAGGAAATDSIQRCPNGSGGGRNTSSYLARTPSPDAANNCPPPPVAAAIHDIQGNSGVSPFVGQTVITTGIVTARKSNGFFMQEPDGNVDADENTSEGIFVFTGAGPTATVGDSVTVVGSVSEFFGLTQISSSVSNITVNSSGNLLPVPIVLTTSILDPAGPPDQLERFEGMRVHAGPLVSVAPTNEFGETFTVLQGVARPLREPGIEVSLPVPPDPTPMETDCCIPRWDENPERLMIDSDGLLGSTRVSVTSHVNISAVTGPLDFTFSDYKVLPETTPIVSPNISAVAVPAPTAGEFTIAGFNIENFNNNATQRQKAALAIRDVLLLPDIIGTIEIFDLADLQALATEIQNISGVTYEARLIEADGATEDADQDVGFLVKTSRIQIDTVTQVELAGCNGTAATCNTFIDPTSGLPALLNDRPPLVLRATVDPSGVDPRQIIVIVNHLRSFIDIELVAGEGPRVRAKRKAQAEFLANLLQQLQTSNPTTPVISIGDYNAYQFSDGYTDPVATIKGSPTPDEQIVVDESPDLVNPNLINLTDGLLADQRYSFIFEGTPQAIDHFILNTAANSLLRRYTVARNNSDFPTAGFETDATRPERCSDHDMPIAYFQFPCVVVCPTNVTKGNDPGLCGAVVNYAAPVPSASCSTVTCSPVSGSFFPVGTTTVTCTDTGGSSCSFTVTVNDTEAPVITGVSANPSLLWPPNHKLVPVTVNYSASDNCAGVVTTSLSVTSNEPINSSDDGDTSPDWIVQDAHHVLLRAERSGTGTGRIYTITITATDSAGNSSIQTVVVTVPITL